MSWMPIYDGYYDVNELGEIRRAKPGIATFVGRPVRPIQGPTGYAQVQLHFGDRNRRAYVHHVVAEAFLGPRPPGCVVNHIDGNRLNNALANLEYVTSKENAAHALRTRGRTRGPTKPKAPLRGRPCGERHWSHRRPDRVARGEGRSLLTDNDVRRMRALRAEGWTYQAIATEFRVCSAQAYRIVKGLQWRHVQ